MVKKRVTQKTACDGVRSVWNAVSKKQDTVQTPSKLSVDGVLMHKEGSRYVRTVRIRQVPVIQIKERQVPIVNIGGETILRNFIRGAYTIRLRSFRGELAS